MNSMARAFMEEYSEFIDEEKKLQEEENEKML